METKKLSDLVLALHENTLDVKSHPGKPLPGSLQSLGGQVHRGAATGVRACFHMFMSFYSEPMTSLTFSPKVRTVKTKLTLNSFFPLFPILFLDRARG